MNRGTDEAEKQPPAGEETAQAEAVCFRLGFCFEEPALLG
jgi:hypothetical protein